MNGHGRNDITVPFKKEKKQREFPAKFDIERIISQPKCTVKCSGRIPSFF